MRAVAFAVPVAVGLTVLAPAAAQAGERHHEGRHHDKVSAADREQRKAARVAARREARRAARQQVKPTPPVVPASPVKRAHPATRHVKPKADCTVTATRPDTVSGAWTITNGCDAPQTVDYVVQAYAAGAFEQGICKATGHCWTIRRGTLTVPPGTHQYVIAAPGCWVQVDLKWHGRLIKAGHYGQAQCTHDKPKPPPHKPHPRPPVITPHHHDPTPHHLVRLTATPTSADALPRTGASADLAPYGLGFLAMGVALVALTRKPKAQADAIRESLGEDQ